MSPTRILITGGGRGIGRAIALHFAQPGVKICVAARTSAELDKVVEEIEAKGGEAIAAQCNLRDHGSIEAAVFRAVDFFGGEMDLLVNNAGIFDIKPLDECDPDMIQRFLEVNLIGAMQVTQEALPALREAESACVVMVNSTAGLKGYPGSTVYCATKYALRGFADALREELAEDGVHVRTVYPDVTDTTMLDGLDIDRSDADSPETVASVVARAATGEDDRNDIPVRE